MKLNQTHQAQRHLKDGLGAKARGRRSRQSRAHEAQQRTDGASRRNDLAPELTLVEMAVADLKAPRRAVRKLDPAHVREVAASIEALGYCDPILINRNGEILDGVIRFAAAQELGLARLACIRIDHLEPQAERALRIACNRLGERGSWDIDELRIELEELIELEAPIEILGFESAELDLILQDDEAEGAPCEDDEPLPQPAAVAVCRVGDAWSLGEHRLICADATDALTYERLMGEERARLVLTDPPYNVPIAGHVSGLGRRAHREFVQGTGEMSPEAFAAFLSTVIGHCADHSLDGGLIAPFIDWRSLQLMLEAGQQVGLGLINLVVWSKPNGGMGSLYRSAHELLPIFKVGKAAHVNNVALGKHGRWRANVWTYPGGSSLGSDARDRLADHPTPKPVAMLEDALYDVTHRGEIVLDPFLGSGSTLIAAQKAGRICFGAELDPLYVDVTLRRWMAMTGRQPVLAGTGETFAEVEQRRAQPSAPLALPAPASVEAR